MLFKPIENIKCGKNHHQKHNDDHDSRYATATASTAIIFLDLLLVNPGVVRGLIMMGNGPNVSWRVVNYHNSPSMPSIFRAKAVFVIAQNFIIRRSARLAVSFILHLNWCVGASVGKRRRRRLQ